MSHSAVTLKYFITGSDFSSLIDSTTVEEDNEVYLTKLALSVGRSTYHLTDLLSVVLIVSLAIIRPKSETVISVHDRHPTRKRYIDI